MSVIFNWTENVGTKQTKNAKAFINNSQTVADIYEELEDYNQSKKIKVLIVFYGFIADVEANKNWVL